LGRCFRTVLWENALGRCEGALGTNFRKMLWEGALGGCFGKVLWENTLGRCFRKVLQDGVRHFEKVF